MAIDQKAVKAIFLDALDRPAPAERAAFLDQACEGNAALRECVETLLKSHDRPDALLDQPAIQHVATEAEAAALAFLEPTTRPGALGRLGHYDVLELVGQGGMGVVVRAFDAKLHRVVAIKALFPGLAGDRESRQRFIREAQAAAAVTHDNVIDIHAVEDGGPVPYLVMQFIQGCTLQEKLERVGPLPLKEVLRIGLQTAEGLAAAHRQGLIHRDIKPANILLENGIERVKITDFGLARAVDGASLTRSGVVAGTPAFMSPEQAEGLRTDHRSDLFSLGSVLYTLCAGHPPFRAKTAVAVLKRVCEETPRPLREVNPDVPEWLQELIAKLHAKNPDDRYASAAEVAAVLSRRLAELQRDGYFSDNDRTVAKPAAVRPESKRSLATRTNVGIALAAVVAVIAGWLIYQSWNSRRQTPNDDTTAPPGPVAGSMPTLPMTLSPSHKLMQHTGAIRTLAVSPDGKVLASGGHDHHIYLWDTQTWEPRGPLEGHPGNITSLAFSPDSKRLASVTSESDNCLIRIWDVAGGKPLPPLGTGGRGSWDVAWSPDGKTLACGGWDKALHLVDVETGKERPPISGVTSLHLRTLSFSPDSTKIATGGSGPTLMWETATGKEIVMPVKLRAGMCPTILAGGTRLAGWNYGDGLVTICELPSGRMLASWQAHPKIEGFAASADGRFIASFGSDKVARIWLVGDKKEEVATLIGHEGQIYAAAFTPDGTKLITGGVEDLSIRVWDLPEMCRAAK